MHSVKSLRAKYKRLPGVRAKAISWSSQGSQMIAKQGGRSFVIENNSGRPVNASFAKLSLWVDGREVRRGGSLKELQSLAEEYAADKSLPNTAEKGWRDWLTLAVNLFGALTGQVALTAFDITEDEEDELEELYDEGKNPKQAAEELKRRGYKSLGRKGLTCSTCGKALTGTKALKVAERYDGARPSRRWVIIEADGFVRDDLGAFATRQEAEAAAKKADQEKSLGTKAQPSDDISPEKACQILKDGTANGEPLTDAQRGMFGAACGRKGLGARTKGTGTYHCRQCNFSTQDNKQAEQHEKVNPGHKIAW